MKATFRLPSKAVQYGYVEVSVDVPEDPDAIGRMYQAYVEVFQKGEKAQKALSGPAHPALVSRVEVFAREAGVPVQDILKAQEEFLSSGEDAKQVVLDAKAAAERVAKGEKPRTVDEADEMVKQIIENELGPVTELGEVYVEDNTGEKDFAAPELDAPAAPWESEAPAPKKKPWETSGTPKKAPVVNLFG